MTLKWGEGRVSFICTFSNQIFESRNIQSIHRSWQIIMFCVKFMTYCDLEKYQGHHVLATLCVQMLHFQFILVGGLLTGSDTCIMAKIDAIWLTFVSYGPVVTLKIQLKVTDLISILPCIILVFLLIWLQSSHWISRHSTYNRYFVCLDFAVSIILWPYEMRSRSHNKLFFLPKVHLCKFSHNSSTSFGDLT